MDYEEVLICMCRACKDTEVEGLCKVDLIQYEYSSLRDGVNYTQHDYISHTRVSGAVKQKVTDVDL